MTSKIKQGMHLRQPESSSDGGWVLRMLAAMLACGALLFALLLIYVLFFALPFSDTYVTEGHRCVCRSGVYALCRHPGFWMMLFSFVCLVLAIQRIQLLYVALLCNGGNLLYILFQDIVSFPRQFDDYEQYKKEVPFLMITGSSVRQCRKTWR